MVDQQQAPFRRSNPSSLPFLLLRLQLQPKRPLLKLPSTSQKIASSAPSLLLSLRPVKRRARKLKRLVRGEKRSIRVIIWTKRGLEAGTVSLEDLLESRGSLPRDTRTSHSILRIAFLPHLELNLLFSQGNPRNLGRSLTAPISFSLPTLSQQ